MSTLGLSLGQLSEHPAQQQQQVQGLSAISVCNICCVHTLLCIIIACLSGLVGGGAWA